MSIPLKDGKLIIRNGKVAISHKCCCKSTVKPIGCGDPYIIGCSGCSCCGAQYYLVCLSGATGDCAVINNNSTGWTLSNGGSGGSYVFQNAMIKLTLELSTHWDAFFRQWGGLCRTWALKAYRNSGGTWVECLSAAGVDDWWADPAPEFYSLGRNCDISGAKNGISFTIRPKEKWYPEKFRLTISGHTSCATACTGSTYNNFFYKVNSVSLDGTYEVPLDEITQNGDCYYLASGVGSYSYSTWTSSDCSGPPAKTITGKFNVLISLSGIQLRVRIVQDTFDATVAGDDFHSWCNLTPEQQCKTLNLTGQVNYDNRCPLAWGYWNTSWVRTGYNATATVVAVP